VVAITIDGAAAIAKAAGLSGRVAEEGDGLDPYGMAMCVIDGVQYAQSRNADGTYMLSRMDVTTNGDVTVGLSFTGLAFDPDQVHEEPHRFGWYAKPEMVKSEYPGSSVWNFSTSSVIIDNHGLGAGRTTELLGLAKPTGFALMLARVGDGEPQRANGKGKRQKAARGRAVAVFAKR
jgi:hypothetical protein